MEENTNQQNEVTTNDNQANVSNNVSDDNTQKTAAKEESVTQTVVEPTPKKEVPSQKKEKKYHPVLNLILSGIVALGCGFGGSALYNQMYPQSKITYQTVQTTTAPVSTLSNTSPNTAITGDNLTIQEIAAVSQPSIVEIKTEVVTSYQTFMGTASDTSEAAGSGVILTDDGYIVTNNHVIEDAQSITVRTFDGEEYDASLVATDAKSDLAVLKINATKLQAVTIGDSDSIVVGDTAVAIGNPLGELGGTVTSGIISALDREITIDGQAMNLLQTNAEVNPGNSGGGLFNSKGELIGIVNAKSSGTNIEGIGFAIPSNNVRSIVDQLINDGYVSNRATLGVYLSSVTQAYMNYQPGLYISEVIEGSAAEAAGLEAYDRIVKADNIDISSYEDLSRILNKKNVGDTLDLVIERNGEELDIQVTLQQAINA